MFNNAVNIPGPNPIFNQGNQVDINIYQTSGSRGLQGFERLLEHVATGAFHNSGEVSDAPKCHPGTRVTILESVFAWATATFYLVCIQWIYGPAGAGKSAILRTLAEMLEQRGLLLASFFFFRAAAGRNNADRFIPTLAYQIARSIPSTRRFIEQAIEADPLIFSQSLEAQAQALIIHPLIQAHKEGSIEKQYPRIIVIDGLDECDDKEKQCMLLRVLNNMLLKLPIPFAILVASRPEYHIRTIFNSDLNKTSTRLELDNSYEPDKDILKFYEDKFLEICKHHPLHSHLPKPWPPPPIIATLVDKASGQFIFPATVIKFVEPHRHNPSQRLEMVMGSISPGKLRPFEALDNLYSTIFTSVDPDDLKAILRVLGVLLVPYSIIDISDTDFLTCLTGFDEAEIKHLLFDLESLLQIGVGRIHVHHASLADFLFDQHRSGQFFVSSSIVYEQLAHRAMEILLLSEDETGMHLVFCELGHIFNNLAEPTKELIKALEDCDTATLSQKLEGKKYLLLTLQLLFDEVLPAISSSALPEFLHTHLLTTLQEVIASKVDYCFNTNLTPLLVYLMIIGCQFSNAFEHDIAIYHICSTQIYPIQKGHSPVEIEIQDQQDGFCLTLLSYSELADFYSDDLEIWDSFHTLLINIIGDQAGYCYADFAIHTLNWISKFPIIQVLPDEVSNNDLKIIAASFLPTLLRKSPPRLDVQQALKDNPFHSIMLEKIPEYAAAIWEYFQRANNIDPSQADSDTDSSQADSSSCASDNEMV